MSISNTSTAPMAAQAPAQGRPGEFAADGKSLFSKAYARAGAGAGPTLAGDEAEGDLAAMLDLARMAGGNNDSAAFAARTRGAGEAAEISIESLQNVLAEGGLASWLVSDEADELSLAELRAEVIGGEVLPAYGLERRSPRLPDPAAPDYLDQVRRRLVGIGEAGPTPPAPDALDRVLREERARMTERMVAALARS
ncbi:MAG: hypothetical protein C0481_05600 [Phenylobacterium sp.]|uniref:hypothetical protein n=1 Tax=Phenylobacterium sp. TaxID=1871053 RepID=UPI0025F78B8C|nr:hypothetical protein [Phenylobacterium sp.]MBA4011323.1 hypothetical protein [Phenylobacterium sp.]